MANKQTAVEWLIEVLWAPCQGIPSDIIDQAKQMEKEQIIKAYWASYKEGQYSGDKTAEEYYNETYGKQDND
jgi:hypothetical protein